MFNHLAPAMRRALAATRAANLTEATRLLQEALTGKPPQKPEAETARPARQRRSLGDTLAALRKEANVPPAAQPAAPALPDGCAFLRRSITTSSGSRDYRLFVPASATPRGLIVMLHGCKQTAEDFAVGTAMNHVAAAEAMLVAYPTQPQAANPSGCWNWFRPEDQLREAGEPHILAEMTRRLADEFAVGARVFIAGLSAGGAMAAIMGATYPDIYQAIGIHSGLPYRAAHDVQSAFAAMRGSKLSTGTDKAPPLLPRQIVFHGTADQTVVPANARLLMETAVMGLDSRERLERHFTAGSRQVTHTEVLAQNGTLQAEAWLVAGGGHHWFGGDPAGSFAKLEGPSASREMMRFFLGKRLGRA